VTKKGDYEEMPVGKEAPVRAKDKTVQDKMFKAWGVSVLAKLRK